MRRQSFAIATSGAHDRTSPPGDTTPVEEINDVACRTRTHVAAWRRNERAIPLFLPLMVRMARIALAPARLHPSTEEGMQNEQLRPVPGGRIAARGHRRRPRCGARHRSGRVLQRAHG